MVQFRLPSALTSRVKSFQLIKLTRSLTFDVSLIIFSKTQRIEKIAEEQIFKSTPTLSGLDIA